MWKWNNIELVFKWLMVGVDSVGLFAHCISKLNSKHQVKIINWVLATRGKNVVVLPLISSIQCQTVFCLQSCCICWLFIYGTDLAIGASSWCYKECSSLIYKTVLQKCSDSSNHEQKRKQNNNILHLISHTILTVSVRFCVPAWSKFADSSVPVAIIFQSKWAQ